MRRLMNYFKYWLVAKRRVSIFELRTNGLEFIEMIADYSSDISKNQSVNPDRINDIVSKDFSDAKIKMENQGITVFPHLIDKEVLEAAATATRKLVDSFSSESGSGTDVIIKRDGIDNFPITSDQTVANIRAGADEGMIDVFNVEKSFHEFQKYKDNVLEVGILELVEELAEAKMSVKNINVYINQGVTRTRGLHVDSYGVNQFKFFTYLTDVDSLDNGPYCYGLATHKLKGLRETNMFLNKALGRQSTDLTLVPRESVIPILGKAGSSILSNQSGAHGGFPQADAGQVRCLVMVNFVTA